MVEVIAKRKRRDIFADWIIGGFIAFFIGLFFVFLVGSIIVTRNGKDPTVLIIMCIILGLLSGGLIGSSIWEYIKFKRTPEEIVTFDGEKFFFAGKVSCGIDDIERLRYEKAKGGRYGAVILPWGKLYVTIHGKEYKFNYVDGLEKVCRVIEDIIAEVQEYRGSSY